MGARMGASSKWVSATREASKQSTKAIMLGGEDGTEEEGALRGWQPSGGYEPLRWLLPKGWVLRLAAWRCPLARASLVSLHDGAGRLLAVRRVAPDGTFRHRGVRFRWDGATFREERGLHDGQLTCGQLLASTGVHSDRRSALLQQHGLNEYTSVARRSRIPGTRWLAIGSFLWLLRSHYLTAGIAAFVVSALWLSQTCECLIGRFRSRRVVHSPTTLALPNAEEVESSLLVPGDVIALKQGDRAPCDMVLLSGDCVVDQGDVALPALAARWPLTAPECELFSVHKHRTSVILRPSRIACSRGQLLAVVLRTGAATESAMLCSRPEWLYVEDEEGLGPAQWAVAAAAFLLSLLFWLGRDRFTWDEVLLRALSLHLLLFPPRALLANWLLEKVAVSALASARATSSRSALSSVACWGRTSRVAIDSAGALCEAAEKLAGVLPAGCHGFAPVIARGLSQLPRGHPLRWAAAAVGAALWKEGSHAAGHPHEVATFAAAGSGLKADGDGYGLDTPPESPGPPLRLAPFVNPFWSTQRLDEDLRETRDPPDVISSVVVEEDACVRRAQRLHYALSYRTLVVLRKHFPGLLSSVRDSVSVLGGLPADRAAAAMRQLGIQTVCAGATLGLAASQRGAIVVGGRAPWPPLACDSVADVPRVALAARRVLGCRGATLDYVALSVCLQACALLVLYAQRATFTDRMHVYLELVACGGPTAALAVSRQRGAPPPRQDAAAFVLHALCWLAAQVALLGQLHCRGWYARLPERLQRRLDASVVCLLASYQLPLLAVQLAAFRGGLRPVAVACVLPIAATTALMFPWAASASLALGLPRWPRDRETLLLRMGIVLAALLNLLVDALAQLFVAPKFRSDAQPADAMRVPVAETHVGVGTGARQ
ncbi:uncharacterized protein [Dermacentor albipictus]|uniref:uncharacterized protein isoform X3 n=1 Tax=Dermacentor albipictus TaxID=60249 RepID=UPI0031FE3F88